MPSWVSDVRVPVRQVLANGQAHGACPALSRQFLAFSFLSFLSLRSLDQERLATLRQSVTSTLFLKTAGWHRSFYPQCPPFLFHFHRNEPYHGPTNPSLQFPQQLSHLSPPHLHP